MLTDAGAHRTVVWVMSHPLRRLLHGMLEELVLATLSYPLVILQVLDLLVLLMPKTQVLTQLHATRSLLRTVVWVMSHLLTYADVC
jgi:hypothetical protein